MTEPVLCSDGVEFIRFAHGCYLFVGFFGFEELKSDRGSLF